MDTLPFWVLEVEEEEDGHVKGLRRTNEAVLQQIPVDVLRGNLTKMVQSLATLITDIRTVGQFRLAELTFQVEVTGSGGIQFIGTASVAGKAAITLKFTGG